MQYLYETYEDETIFTSTERFEEKEGETINWIGYIPEDWLDVWELFKKADRDYYSDDAYKIMYELYEEENACRENPRDFDVIAWACDFDEFDVDYILTQYDYDLPDDWDEMDEEDQKDYIEEQMSNYTMAWKTSDGILYVCY